MAQEIHINDVGTVFEATLLDESVTPSVVVDLTSNTVLQLIFVKPDKTRVVQTAVVVGAETAGVIAYTILDGDLDMTGTWRIQAYIEVPTGKWSSTRATFEVFGNL